MIIFPLGVYAPTGTVHSSSDHIPIDNQNRLAGSASPYLREAAHQPVHWQPWGEAAFQLAQQVDKPILLDIGAVWCHWCHVMDVESYENHEIADLINQHFIAIKVDMDERPDIDRRYQEAVQALTGHGGWPLTAFLTPKGQVFFGGTYFPPATRSGRAGLKELLPVLVHTYSVGKADILASAAHLAKALANYGVRAIEKGEVSEAIVQSVMASMVKEFDRVNGGFGTSTKFPAGSALELAMARYFDNQDHSLLQMVTRTLDAMALGGVYDHLGGGFFRYTTDSKWTTPHFEKMNYDNAELLINYLHAYQATGKELYRERAKGIMTYVDEVLSNPDAGGFYAHQDADMTRKDDGDYYTWTVQEVRQALSSEEAEVILRYYDIQAQGEMHKNPAKNVLRIAMTPEALAHQLKVPTEIVSGLIHQGTQRLSQARLQRKAPLVDRTMYIDRNAMLITAYLEAFQVLGDEPVKAFALKTLDGLLDVAYRKGQGMYHAFFEGNVRVSGLLNDQVHMATAALKAFEVTGRSRYRDVAQDLMTYTIKTFWDVKGGGFVDRAPQDNALAALDRSMKNVSDSPSTSPNAVAAVLLNRLAAVTNDERFAQIARSTLEAFAGSAPRRGRFAAGYALAVHHHLHPSAQAVIIGKLEDEKTSKLWKAAAKSYRPGKLVTMYDPTTVKMKKLPPAVVGAIKAFGLEGEPRAYVCAGVTCAPPTTDPNEVATLVRSYGVSVPPLR
ncbi:MAG: thioredoxin domain-containing protein [Nitrospirota bacterium]|nr:thioredoxin domain-containing protein [Nitrospirota bacterium]